MGYIQGADRNQVVLLPETLDEKNLQGLSMTDPSFPCSPHPEHAYVDPACKALHRICRNARVKCAVLDLGTKKERLSAKSRILHELAKRLRVE